MFILLTEFNLLLNDKTKENTVNNYGFMVYQKNKLK